MIPHTINYNIDPPVSIPHKQRHYRQLPASIPSGNVTGSEIIRFVIARDNIWWDPYSAYIRLRVTATFPSITTATGVVAQLDGSAYSFISSLVIRERDYELERIDNFDMIANIVNDMNAAPPARTARDYLGGGGVMGPNLQPTLTSSTFQSSSAGVSTLFYIPRRDLGVITSNNGNAVALMLDAQGRYAPQLDTTPSGIDRNAQPTPNLNILNTRNTPIASSQGFADPFPVNFSTTTYEPVFTGGNYIRNIKNGEVVVSNGENTHEFFIPLFSGLLGCIKPPSQYKLIPLKAFQNLVIELKMNKYALFSSSIVTGGLTNDTARAYKIDEIELNAEVLETDDRIVNDALEKLLQNNGINITGVSYFAGPKVSFTNNSIPNTIELSTGFGSLKAVYLAFRDKASDQLPYARRNYRLSHNLTSLQMRIGAEYYPPQPITGAAGTSYSYPNNNEFYHQLLRTFKKLPISDSFAINPHNFAVNFRQITSGKYPDQAITNNVMLGFYQYFYENRCTGKAVFGIELNSANHDHGLLGGIDTRFMLPYQILLENDNDSFIGETEACVFFYYDLLISVSYNSVNVKGKN